MAIGTYLEHANITVPDIDAATEFLRVIDPDLTIRHDEKPPGGTVKLTDLVPNQRLGKSLSC